MRFPECPTSRADCRFTVGPETATCIGWTPEYDRHGNLLNSDPNYRHAEIECRTCNRRWRRDQDASGVHFRTMPPETQR